MARIELDGFDELNKLLESMTISEEDEKKSISAALEPVKKEVEKNTPEGKTRKLKASVKTKVGKEDGQVIGKVILDEYYGRFQEYGTSTQNKNVGFFARSIRKSKGEAMKVLKAELLTRLK
ncbi:HK97 gp10 family phage protein [Sedimentibacter hydroxybenzoicus DSM 7310]|uniref:HK97 gp10 family phage protein n=1 Tax=Sedimentibacter hydroxybenzoicus DSM 7310 TaxID=1123245 RepID=A0A974BJ77_SEDHY|nr:HK97-gp10 family putative phage morphogenesis protein [Sedimentibacter hydroxybenzoicus]NYB73856.1 HK97 gp10 family phage protein [Sedimentibacter hydroxybenzoicus DSM 7310]